MKTTTEEGIAISTPKCEAGIGKIIRTPESADLIDGVKVRSYDLWPDDRGYFLEVVRVKQGLAADFVPEMTQVSAALSYPGTIKAFHYHLHQTDLAVFADLPRTEVSLFVDDAPNEIGIHAVDGCLPRYKRVETVSPITIESVRGKQQCED